MMGNFLTLDASDFDGSVVTDLWKLGSLDDVKTSTVFLPENKAAISLVWPESAGRPSSPLIFYAGPR